MLNALGRDLQEIPQAELILIRDRRLAPVDFAATVVPVQTDDYFSVLEELLVRCDAFIPIAPETNGELLRLCQLSERKACTLLSSGSSAVSIASSKLLTVKALQQAGIRCVETRLWEQEMSAEDIPFSFPIILKPDDGIGCEGQYIIETPQQLARLTAERINNRSVWLSDSSQGMARYVVQPYLSGQAASLSVVYHPSQAHLLSANIQCIERKESTILLRGCKANELDRDGLYLEQLSQDISYAIPGLAGYVGIDFLVHRGSLSVLEINPRLTLSYIGLSDAININPAKLIFSLAQQITPAS